MVIGSKKIDEAELEITLVRIEAGKTPEDIFGIYPSSSTGELLEKVRKIYLRLQHVVHPDFYSDRDSVWERVKNASGNLNAKWEEAKKRIEQGIYGTNKTVEVEDNKPVVVQSRLYTYTLIKRIHVGNTCGVFEGTAQDKKGNLLHAVIKVPHSKDDNDLMDREAKNLGRIRANVDKLRGTPEGDGFVENALMVLPRFLESVRLKEGKVVNTFIRIPGYESGWYSVEQIRNKFPKGVDSRVMVFICNRALESLVLAHESGVTHGAITPNHIIIHAAKHLGNVVDWSSSCFTKESEKIPYHDKDVERFMDPEVVKSRTPFQSSDLYSLAKSMICVSGVDPEDIATSPIELEDEFCYFFNKCLQPNRRHRFSSSRIAYDEFRRIQKEVFGPPKFVELVM